MTPQHITIAAGHHNFKGSIADGNETADQMALFHDRDDRPRADMRVWGSPATATTTQTALKWRQGRGRIVQPPEFAPPHYHPMDLDICVMPWTWELED